MSDNSELVKRLKSMHQNLLLNFPLQSGVTDLLNEAISALTAQEQPKLPEGYTVDMDRFNVITAYWKGEVVHHIFQNDDLHPLFSAFLPASPEPKKAEQFMRSMGSPVAADYLSDDTRTGPEDRRMSASGDRRFAARCGRYQYGRRKDDRARWTTPQPEQAAPETLVEALQAELGFKEIDDWAVGGNDHNAKRAFVWLLRELDRRGGARS